MTLATMTRDAKDKHWVEFEGMRIPKLFWFGNNREDFVLPKVCIRIPAWLWHKL